MDKEVDPMNPIEETLESGGLVYDDPYHPSPFDDLDGNVNDFIPPKEGVGIGSYRLNKDEEQPPDDIDPEFAIPKLFERMKPQRKILLALIDYCREDRYSDDIDSMLHPLMANRKSVYAPATLRELLERNGALKYTEADEESIPEESMFDEDGNLVVVELPEGTWKSTPEGLRYLESQNPENEALDIIEKHSEYKRIYLEILEFCATKPRSASEIDELVNDNPLLQNPRRFSGYFVGHLEDTDALEWIGKWTTTNSGKAVLEELRNTIGEKEGGLE